MNSPATINPRLASFSIILPNTAGTLWKQDIDAEFVACDLSGEDFLMAINDAAPSLFGQGRKYRAPDGTRIVKVTLTPTATAALNPNTIRLAVGIGDFLDNRFASTAGLSISGAVQQKAATTLTQPNAEPTLVAATNTQIAFANQLRRQITVFNQSAVDSVRLSTLPAELTAGKGLLLKPGAAADISCNGDLWARSAGTPTLNCAEELYV